VKGKGNDPRKMRKNRETYRKWAEGAGGTEGEEEERRCLVFDSEIFQLVIVLNEPIITVQLHPILTHRLLSNNERGKKGSEGE